jgi:hypothetical protein
MDDQPAAAEEPSDLTDEQPVDDEVSHAERHAAVRETLALVLLAVTAIMTAWCGFESSKWGGEMSVSFSRASTDRGSAAARWRQQRPAAGSDDLFRLRPGRGYR